MDDDRMEAFVMHVVLGKKLDPPLQPEERQTAGQLRREIEWIESQGLVVDIPFEIPDISDTSDLPPDERLN